MILGVAPAAFRQFKVTRLLWQDEHVTTFGVEDRQITQQFVLFLSREKPKEWVKLLEGYPSGLPYLIALQPGETAIIRKRALEL